MQVFGVGFAYVAAAASLPTGEKRCVVRDVPIGASRNANKTPSLKAFIFPQPQNLQPFLSVYFKICEISANFKINHLVYSQL